MPDKFHKLLLLFLLLPLLAAAQEKSPRITELEKHFQNFEYGQILRKGWYFLKDPATTKEDSLNIYQLMLSSSYVVQDTVEAGNIIRQIIREFPLYNPDPLSVSPKIIEFFQDYKNKLTVSAPDELKKPGLIRPVIPAKLGLNILLPGSGFSYEKFPVRKMTYLGASAVSMTLLTYFAIRTKQAEKKYLSQDQQHKIDQAYREYNKNYRNRNFSIIGWVLLSLTSTADLINSGQYEFQFSIIPAPDSITLSLQF